MFLILTFIILGTTSSYAIVIFEDDFEYSANASTCGNVTSLDGWKWTTCQDEGTNSNANADVNIISTNPHAGTRCLQIDYSPVGDEPNPYSNSYIEWNDSSTFTTDVWIQLWMKIELKGSDPNGWWGTPSSGNKFIYSNTSETQAWCIVLKGSYVTTAQCSATGESSIGADEVSLSYYGFGGATPPSGQNTDNTVLIPEETWVKLIVHISMALANTPHVQYWVDIQDSNGLQKVMDWTFDNESGCKPWTGDVSSVLDRIKFGTTFADQSYLYFDDIIIGTSTDDMHWEEPGGTSISSPGNLTGTLQ